MYGGFNSFKQCYYCLNCYQQNNNNALTFVFVLIIQDKNHGVDYGFENQ